MFILVAFLGLPLTLSSWFAGGWAFSCCASLVTALALQAARLARSELAASRLQPRLWLPASPIGFRRNLPNWVCHLAGALQFGCLPGGLNPVASGLGESVLGAKTIGGCDPLRSIL